MEWYHVWWPWLTSKRVARLVSDSWVSCLAAPVKKLRPTTEPTRVFAVVGVLVHCGARTATLLRVLATQSALVVTYAWLCTPLRTHCSYEYITRAMIYSSCDLRENFLELTSLTNKGKFSKFCYIQAKY